MGRRGQRGTSRADWGSGSWSPIVSSQWLPIRRGARRARGWPGRPDGRLGAGRRNPCQSLRLLAPLGAPRPGGRANPAFSPQGGAPRDGRPFPGPFVPGNPDAPLAAAPAKCLFLRQLSLQLLSPHNGVRTRPPGFGSGELPLFPRLG